MYDKQKFKTEMGKRVKDQRESLKITQEQLAKTIGYKGKSIISRIEAGLSEIPQSKMQSFADALDTTIPYLMGWEDINDSDMNHPTIASNYVKFPVIGEVAAGYDHFGEEDWTNGEVDIPSSWLNGRSCDEYFVLRVTGDSMYPLYQDGDIVLVHSQPVLDHNGQIAVVRYEDVNATLKRVEQGENVVKLYPVNPQFPPLVIRGVSLTQYSILGVPKMLIRNLQ